MRMTSESVPAPLSLHFVSGPLAEQSFLIEKWSVTLGRDLANDIPIKSDLQVSRQHARLLWSDGGWIIENLSHGNTVRVNDEEVQRAILANGATVTLGDSTRFTVTPLETVIANVPASATAAVESDLSKDIHQQVADVTAPPASAPTISSAPTGERANRVEATQVASLTELGVPSLEITSNTHAARQKYPLTRNVTSIGRDHSNDLVIDDRIVSGQHLQIVREGKNYALIHPHPSRPRTLNGLYYQGRKIRGDQPFKKTLANGDIFRIGDEDGTLVTIAFHDGSDISRVGAPPLKPIALNADELTIGRESDNSIVLTHPQVSGRHAKLTREGDSYRIVDLNSTNHIYVNGEPINSYLLAIGDEIRLGPYRMLFEGAQLRQYDESKFIRIDAIGLQKQSAAGVTLLDDISLSIPPNSFVALVGGSGAGKSTLMDALNGQRPAQGGSVLYNGHDYYRNMALYSGQIGYVPQDDIVHRDLTVERALYFAAKLRLPSDFTEEQIEQRIAEVLEEVELTHRRALMVRDLSGGQRKRVSIALELLANPSVFFLDEPTSGLDPGLDRKMMFLLRKLADRGHTIVLVTHATNNINSCDYVCFLAQGGRLTYFGPPEETKTYFDKTDFAEIYTNLEATEEAPAIPEQARTRFLASPEYERYVSTPLHAAPKAASKGDAGAAPRTQGAKQLLSQIARGWSQFTLLSRRYAELLRNDLVNLMLLLLQAPVVALLLIVMVRVESGSGIFDANTITQCRTQIITSTGVLALPEAQRAVVTNCQHALNFLLQNPTGQAYAQQHGGTKQALQNFLVQGAGSNAQTVLFIMAFATILFGCINGAREIVKEAPIYRRERAVNLGITAYMFSKIAILGVLCLFQSAAFVLIAQIGEPLRQGVFTSPTLETYITLCLTSFAGLMTGLVVSAVAPNTDRAISFVPIVLLPQVIVSGAIIPLKDWVTQIVASIFPSRWAMAALGTIVGIHADTLGGDRLFGTDSTYHGDLFSIYSQADALKRLLLSWAVLAFISVLLMVVIAVFLKRKDVRA